MADPDPRHKPPAEVKSQAEPIRSIEKADVAVTEAAADVRDAWPVRMLGHAAELADQPPLLALSAATLAGGLALRSRPVAEAGARVLLSVLTATAIKTLIKRAVDRTRPHLLVEEGRYRLAKGSSTEDGEINSFPSGHTADAVATARAVARVWPEAALPVGATAATVAAIQIPRCRHFLSDVGAGALIGWGAEAAVDALFSRLLAPARPAPASSPPASRPAAAGARAPARP